MKTVTESTRLSCISEICSMGWLDVLRAKESIRILASGSDHALLLAAERFSWLDGWCVQDGETDHEKLARNFDELDEKVARLSEEEAQLRAKRRDLYLEVLQGFGEENA